MKLIPGQPLGKYSTIRWLGSGAFGTVYLMHDNLINRDVAVKFVENKDPAAFVAHFEAQILHQCRHDRIVVIDSADVVQDASGKYFAAIDMEYIPDGSAQDLLDKRHVTVRQAIKITIDALIALEHAHRQGILHRDVKPGNFMLVGGRTKLSDFGLATIASASLTGSGAGSPVYWAPEVLNDNITNARTDIFAMGISLFQLANNISNFAMYIPNLDAIKLGRVIQTAGYKTFFPRRLRNICNRACALDPSKRYGSAFEMRQALEKLRVKQDWAQTNIDNWTAVIGSQTHEMTIEQDPNFEMVYRVNGRRRNMYCVPVTTVEDARSAQCRRVYEATF